ncbi:MAG: RagB/SusD family nutrient uptake outer membrane protein [Adhaeribacter sp.]
MKKITYFLALLAAMAGTSSCEKLLETTPTDFLSPVNYYQNAEHLEFALNGVYKNIYSQYVYGGYYPARFNMMADEGFHARVNELSGPRVYNYATDDSELTMFYRTIWEGINRANELLANIDKPDMDETRRSQIRGEALFLRAHFYFLLVQNYGGVPLILTPTKSSEQTDFPRASVAEVYRQILQDMEAAEPLVPAIQHIGFGGKVSRSAVRGILARVNLYMAGEPLKDVSRYAEASKWAKKVMDDTDAGHRLNPDFTNIFINYAEDKYDRYESIWEAEFYGGAVNPTGAFGRIGSMIGIASNAVIGNSYGFINATAKLYRLYENGDLRRDWTITPFVYSATGTKTFHTNFTNAGLYSRNAAKWRREYEVATPKGNYITPQNFPILRYSDVLLMYAEAENERNGPTPEAVEAVNAVRERAWATGIKTLALTSGGTGYTTAPTVSFVGGGGSEALATATVSGGKVTGLVFARDEKMGLKIGKGYTSAPTVTFTGGGGSGAAATATIFSKSEAKLAPELTASQQEFRLAIRNERMRELAFEAMRKPDLVRWGTFLPEMKQTLSMILSDAPTQYYHRTYQNVAERHILFPFPGYDVNLNKALVQNPGW